MFDFIWSLIFPHKYWVVSEEKSGGYNSPTRVVNRIIRGRLNPVRSEKGQFLRHGPYYVYSS